MGTLLGGGFGKRPRRQEGKPRKSNIPSFSSFFFLWVWECFLEVGVEKDWFLNRCDGVLRTMKLSH